MPIYEFKCNTCEHIFDELVPMNTQGDLMKCPKCASVGARKSRGSFLSATHGLENGHIAVGRKLTGKSGAPASETGSAPASDKSSAPASDKSGAPASDKSSAASSEKSSAASSEKSSAASSDKSSAPKAAGA